MWAECWWKYFSLQRGRCYIQWSDDPSLKYRKVHFRSICHGSWSRCKPDLLYRIPLWTLQAIIWRRRFLKWCHLKIFSWFNGIIAFSHKMLRTVVSGAYFLLSSLSSWQQVESPSWDPQGGSRRRDWNVAIALANPQAPGLTRSWPVPLAAARPCLPATFLWPLQIPHPIHAPSYCCGPLIFGRPPSWGGSLLQWPRALVSMGILEIRPFDILNEGARSCVALRTAAKHGRYLKTRICVKGEWDYI